MYSITLKDDKLKKKIGFRTLPDGKIQADYATYEAAYYHLKELEKQLGNGYAIITKHGASDLQLNSPEVIASVGKGPKTIKINCTLRQSQIEDLKAHLHLIDPQMIGQSSSSEIFAQFLDAVADSAIQAGLPRHYIYGTTYGVDRSLSNPEPREEFVRRRKYS